MATGEHRLEDEPAEPDEAAETPTRVAPREVLTIAVIGLVGITGGAVFGIGYGVVVHGGSTDALTSLASVGIGAIAGIVGTSAVNNRKE